MMHVPSLLLLTFLAQNTSPDPGMPAIPVEQRVADFSQLVNTFRKYYSMGNYKLLKRNADLNENAKWLEDVANPALSDNAFAETLVRWTAQFDDGHVTVAFPFNWNATLGFNVDVFEGGQVRVTSVNTDRLPPSKYPIQNGWELVALDDKPVSEWLDFFTPFSASGSPGSTRRFAARQLTQRFQDIMPSAPERIKSTATVELWDFGGVPHTYEIDWRIAGDVGRRFLPASKLGTTRSSSDEVLAVSPQNAAPVALAPLAALPASRSRLVNSPRSPFFSQSLPRELDPSNTYYGAILTDSVTKRTYGLIRIPTFSPSSTGKALEDLGKHLTAMQAADVKGVIIDLMENPGGSIWFCQQVLQMVAGLERNIKDFKTGTFRIRPSTAWLDAFDSYQTDRNFSTEAKVRADADRERIRARLFSDPTLLTDPLPLNLNASERLVVVKSPDSPDWRTPLLVLVDELTASAGDFFASVIQSEQLGAIAGAPTMGAGGTVAIRTGTVVTEAKVSLAESMMESPDGCELENKGVLPDVPITFRTEANVRNQNAPFLKELFAAMNARRKALGLN